MAANYPMKSFITNKLLPFLAFIVIWHVASLFFSKLILPSPIDVVGVIVNIFQSESFYTSLSITLLRSVGGLIISLILGVIIGFVMHFSKIVNSIMHPVLIVLQSLPIISWILLALIWFDSSIIPVFIVSVSTLPIIVLNVYEGLKEISNDYLELVKFYKLGFMKCLKGLYFPTVITFIVSAYKIIIGLCVKTSVMAEVISRVKHGIGNDLNQAWINIDTTEVLAYTVIIVLFTYMLERVLSLSFNKVLRNYR